jgi:hypothetical protein
MDKKTAINEEKRNQTIEMVSAQVLIAHLCPNTFNVDSVLVADNGEVIGNIEQKRFGHHNIGTIENYFIENILFQASSLTAIVRFSEDKIPQLSQGTQQLGNNFINPKNYIWGGVIDVVTAYLDTFGLPNSYGGINAIFNNGKTRNHTEKTNELKSLRNRFLQISEYSSLPRTKKSFPVRKDKIAKLIAYRAILEVRDILEENEKTLDNIVEYLRSGTKLLGSDIQNLTLANKNEYYLH